MKIYIDSEYKCHIENDGTMTAIETNFFDGKCNDFIEGYRFIPYGQSWERSDGIVFRGQMISPWKKYTHLDSEQRKHEKDLLSKYTESLQVMGVEV